jgi:hypothetical protein
VYGSLGGQITPLVQTVGIAATSAPIAAVPAPAQGAHIPADPQLALLPPTETRLEIPEAHIGRIREFADKHQIPRPTLEIKTAASSRGVVGSAWLGVWGSEGPWGGRGRMIMLALTRFNEEGIVSGTYAYGPPGSRSWAQSGPGQLVFAGKPEANRITFTSLDNRYTFEIMPNGTMNGSITEKSGSKQSRITLRPLWRAPKP